MKAALASLMLLPALATAQTVYRCGPEGREYSHTPCKDGRVVDVADPRDAAEQREARAVAARDAKLAEQLARERRIHDAELARQQAAAIQPLPKPAARPASAAASSAHKKHKKAEPSVADGTMSPLMRAPPPATPVKK